MPEGVAIRFELFHLLLSEITDGEVGRGHALACERRRLARQHLGQSRLAGAVRPEQRDAIQGTDDDVDSGNDAASRVAARSILNRQERARCLERRGEIEFERAVDVRRYDEFHPLEHFQAALRLSRLGGAGAKSVD